MTLKLIVNKDALSYSPIVHPVSNSVIDHATIIVHHRAPELLDMLGLTGTVIRRTA